MTNILLIRHATHDLLGNTLAGRAPGVHLKAPGKKEAERLAERLESVPIRAIFTGPLERDQETAWPLAGRLMMELRIVAAFDEIDFGEWTGRTFAELETQPQWKDWNRARSSAGAPGGETMLEVQKRAVAGIEKLHHEHPGEYLAVFSHGEVIKAALMHYLGMPLDLHTRMEISPASVSIVELGVDSHRVLLVNDVGRLSPHGTP